MMLRVYTSQRGDIGWQTVPVIINTDHIVSYAYPGIMKMVNGDIYQITADTQEETARKLLDVNRKVALE